MKEGGGGGVSCEHSLTVMEEGGREGGSEEGGQEGEGESGRGGGEVVNTISHSLFKEVLLWSND